MKNPLFKNTPISSLQRSSNSVKRKVVLSLGAVMLLFTVSTISWKAAVEPVAEKKVEVIAVNNTAVAALTATEMFEQFTSDIYTAADLKNAGMDYQVFKKAVTGYYNLKHNNKLSADKTLITIVDFNKPSTERRLWIVDIAKKALLFNTLVAHGNGSGENVATTFSNVQHSNQSSLGFYTTGQTYNGKHGLSLKLNGVDNGYNTNAYNRGVVVHGADYVSEDFIKLHGRLGRSQGCPALPMNVKDEVISTIKGNTCLFIAGPQTDYKSDFLNEELAANDYSQLAGGSLQASL